MKDQDSFYTTIESLTTKLFTIQIISNFTQYWGTL